MNRSRDYLPIDFIRTILDYSAEEGTFHWKVRNDLCSAWNTRYPGKIAGSLSDGYVKIRINGELFTAHRLAWAFHYGSWPNGFIDHIDGNPSNNKISNLREATPRENVRNARIKCISSSGYKGVYLYKDKTRWQAAIRTNGKRKWLGIFDTAEEAHAAYCAAAKIHHGEFARFK